jgi:hypothetical protein
MLLKTLGGRESLIVAERAHLAASHKVFYLDFSPISRSINVVDISLTNTEDGLPARFGLRQPFKRFRTLGCFVESDSYC